MQSLIDQNCTPLDLIGPSHFLISSTTNLARYSGDRRSDGTRSDPTALSRSCMAGVFMAILAAALSLRTIASGVPLGRKRPYQLGVSKSAKPCSCADGTSGILGERLLLKIASAFT